VRESAGSDRDRPGFRSTFLAFLMALVFALPASAAEPKVRVNASDLSLQLEVQSAIDRGVDWLVKQQQDGGHWSREDTPAITALALTALHGDPSRRLVKAEAPVLQRGYDFLLKNVQPDGGIYVQNYPNYNTAVSMMALLTANQPAFEPALRKARQYLVELQADFGEKGKLDDAFDGGIGYGSHGPHSDMSNTLLALEALYHSRHLVEDQSLAGAKDLDWNAVLHFIQNCQNLPSHNPQPWATGAPQDKGGFIYSPTESKVPEEKLPDGRVALRSYGSMSYAGLLSYVYADLKQDDPRVQAVRGWLGAHYTLTENPGMGQQGLFYYYHTMAKALTAADLDALVLENGNAVNWRRELALRLINLQSADGSWANENGRWMEKDPALVTAYSLIALEMIHRGL
jgi:squalene-hopene/tetraprenyl-beta-curcumene cyclase